MNLAHIEVRNCHRRACVTVYEAIAAVLSSDRDVL
jgi:hypothetical protein